MTLPEAASVVNLRMKFYRSLAVHHCQFRSRSAFQAATVAASSSTLQSRRNLNMQHFQQVYFGCKAAGLATQEWMCDSIVYPSGCCCNCPLTRTLRYDMLFLVYIYLKCAVSGVHLPEVHKSFLAFLKRISETSHTLIFCLAGQALHRTHLCAGC